MARSCSDAKPPRTKATTSQQGKQTGVKRKKTLDQKIKHRDICRRGRLRKKNQDNQMREENKKMKKELEEKESQAQRREEEIQEYKRAVEEQMAQMRQFPTSLNFEGQSFSSYEQMSAYLLSLTYEQHHQGPDNTNITASDPRPSFVANNISFDAPNNNLSSCVPATGVLDSGAGSFPVNYDDWFEELLKSKAAPGFWDLSAGSSFHANDDDNLSSWIKEMSKSDAAAAAAAAAGFWDLSAGSSFHANDDDNLSSWIKEMSKSDAAAAGTSHIENLVVENQNNELVNQIDHNAMVQRRDLSPTQRSAENERDRQDMPGHNMELERLRKVEAKYKEVVPLLNTMSQLAEESKQMNDTEPYLARRIQEVDNIRQHIQEMHN